MNAIQNTGVGLRPPHYEHIFEYLPNVPWFEAVSENYFGLRGTVQGQPLRTLKKIREHYPIVLHGVSLSIGSVDPLDETYLKQLKTLVELIEPAWVSDHLCWTHVGGRQLHDLLPLPYTEEALTHVTQRVDAVQNFLDQPLVLENVSSYVEYTFSEMTEWEFLSELSKRSGCSLLLDVNNVYVSSVNHQFDPEDFLKGLPIEKIKQFHLAGYSDNGDHLVDTHDHPVWDPVWKLYRSAVQRFGNIPTLIEWDDNIPDFKRLHEEAKKADQIQEECLATPISKPPHAGAGTATTLPVF